MIQLKETGEQISRIVLILKKISEQRKIFQMKKK